MKKILSLYFFALGFLFADAQTKQQIDHLNLPEIRLQVPATDFSGNNQFKELFKLNNNDEKDNLKTLIVNPEEAQDLSSRGKFSHNALNGSVYDLMSDNMPCLVPDMKKAERMPVGKQGRKNIDRMPNSIRENKIIW
ncbi:MAG TPA: hypothetical protein VKT28_09650 [Puia sp.]|nr:hypothetical protein [Puia sp.]